MKKLFLIFLFLLIACPAWGAVRTVCGSGCDYTTWAAAESGATTGDTINVSAGTYSQAGLTLTKGLHWVAVDGIGTVTLTRSTSGAQNVIIAAGSDVGSFTGIIFDGTNVTTSVVHLVSGANNKAFLNCTVNSTGGTPAQLMYFAGTTAGTTFVNPTFTGSPSTAGITVQTSAELAFTNPTIASFTAQSFIRGTGTSVTIIGGSVEASLSQEFIYVPNGGVTSISNLVATLSSNVTSPKSFLRFTGANTADVTLFKNTITYDNTNSLDVIISITNGRTVSVSENTIVNTSASQSFAAIGVLHPSSVSIQKNLINFNGTTQSISGVIIVVSSIPSTVNVSHNDLVSTQTAKQILLVGSDTSTANDNNLDNAIIHKNTVTGLLDNSAVHCIEYGYNKNGIITDNEVVGGGYGIVVKGDETYTNGGVFYNTFKDQKTEQLRVKGVKNLPVYNNTFYLSSGRSIANGQLYITVNSDSANATSTGTIAKNNLFSSQSGTSTVNCDANSSTGLILDNNISYAGGNFKSIAGGTTYTDWATWQAAGYDVHGANVDPLFISATNFHLQSDSPARGAGVNVGLSRTNPPDIGAEPYQQYVPWKH